MTKIKTSSFKKGTKCQICTGCGRCLTDTNMDVISSFGFELHNKKRGISEEMEEDACLIAADIGTTTIAMQLRSLTDGTVKDEFTCLNPQRIFGTDVLSRIVAAEKEDAAKVMKNAVWQVLQEGIIQFRAGCSSKIRGMAIAANTTMVHLLMGMDVSGLGRYPFVPQTLSELRTEVCGLPAVILPGASAFIGADIVAGMEALAMGQGKEITLLLDLGTNGEIVLGNRDRFVAAGTAAGPAFEGNTDCYGTDLMSLTARLLEEGILDSTGLLTEPYFTEGVTIGGVSVTQQYVRQLQMAKAAICTGICVLCKKYGLQDFKRIERVYLAGGMGYYLDAAAAAAIGLFPYALLDKVTAVGNAALEGAFVYGGRIFCRQEEETKEKAKAAAGVPQIEVINLAEEPEFADKYINSMELAPCSYGF